MARPDQKDLALTASLDATLREFKSYEPREETEQRLEVLRSLNKLVKEWVKNVTKIKIPSGEGATAGGKLFTFGSYRLGVHSSGADIDTLAVVPRHIDRSDFFTSFKDMLNQDPNVTELHAVEEAFVPVMKLKYSGVELDILFARLALKEVPDTQELSDDELLRNLDQESVRSLNGCRVAEQLLKLVPRQKEFCVTLRAIKLWAKNHGIYSNSMGFFGGITWAILVARTCQLYPNASPSKLVQKMFFIFSTWTWPHPVLLNELNNERTDMPTLNDLVWDPRRKNADRFHVMPIITPAFPEQNSTHNVTRSSAAVLTAEMKEALEICRDIGDGKSTWKTLFEEVNFFSRYRHFIALIMAAPNEEAELNYGGFLESRIRLLVQSLERNQDILIAHNDPNKHKPSPQAKFDVRPENKRVTVWFIGLEFAEHAKNLDLTMEIQRFKVNVENQASAVKSIGPECQVQIDMFYVKRNNLIQVLSGNSLRRGRRWKKPQPSNGTVSSSSTRSTVTRTSSTSSVPTTPTSIVAPSTPLATSVPGSSSLSLTPSASFPAIPVATTTMEADSTTQGTPSRRKRESGGESSSDGMPGTSNCCPPEKRTRDDTLEDSVAAEIIVEVANELMDGSLAKPTASPEQQALCQEIVVDLQTKTSTNGLKGNEHKMEEVPQTV
uniref:polynucleotide adenylyltransferase n=1 Tax=Caenorhabditis japonica TaxID=281687 RepID=A0A8R1HLF3_CAEJA